jgi:NAD+ kinase
MSRSPRCYENIAFLAGPSSEAQAACQRLSERYGNVAPEVADVVVPLGGDGFMLQALHRLMTSGKPIYGMHRGTVGFLMNEYDEAGLQERLAAAEPTMIHPLLMQVSDIHGVRHEARAINEVSVFRQSYQTARLRILVDGTQRLAELVADGVLIATPAGSTAYNLSVQGPIIPIHAELLALTPISPFRPRRWRGALLPNTARVSIEILDPDKRPAAAVADRDEVRSVRRVEISMDHAITMHMLFDPGHSLDERILREQFGY